MRYKDMERLIERRPFRPFQITVTTGETFDVPHPEILFLADKFVSVFAPKASNRRDEFQEFIWIDLMHIVHVRPLRHKQKRR
jgi:hypothetical protein